LILLRSQRNQPLSFFNELKRRNVIRVATAYLALAWLLTEVSGTLFSGFGMPDWAFRLVVILLALGFLPVLVFSWAFEITPEGVRRESEVIRTAASKERTSGRLNLLTISLIIAALLFVISERLFVARVDSASDSAPEQSNTVIQPNSSIAVLPFVDMSPSGDQAFFGDGIAEEVLDELTRLEGLRVASRTSSFAYRESNTDTRTIANELNVAVVLEGSVRKNGERIRVTAQLINAADGYHLWSKTFEREFSDIFVIQDEIAEAVAGALGVRMEVGDVNAFRGAGTALVEAYEAYLRGMKTPLFPRTESNKRIRFFERAIELDPDYAAAWAALGLTLGSTMWMSSVDDASMILDRAIPVLQRAVDLGPDSSYAYTMLATVNYARLDWISSEQFYLKAMEILPDGTAFYAYANMLMRSGRSIESLRYINRADMAERNPKSPRGMALWTYAAIGEIDKLNEMGNMRAGWDGFPFSLIAALNTGDRKVLRQELRSLTAATAATNTLQEPILEHFDSADQVLAILRSVYEDRDVEWPSKYHDIALLAAFYEDPELALTAISYEARQTTIRYGALWFPVMSEMRKLPGFKQLVKDVNLVEYWRSYGWTDHCRAIGADDFECF
jgi:TolB-like protein